MRRRELVLIGIIILLVGVIAGLGLGALSDDETTGAGSDVATSADTNPSEQEAESEDTAVTPASAEPTTTSTAPTTTTTTTTPPLVQEVANVPEQTVLGLPLDSLLDEVEYAMFEVFGAPDSDTGWIEGCPFDGPAGELNERAMRWGGLLLNFRSRGGVETLINWSWRPGSAIPTGSLPVDPQPDEWVITLHDGVDVDMSLSQIGAEVGIPAVINEFGYPAVQQRGAWTYLAIESVDEPPFEVMARFLICD